MMRRLICALALACLLATACSAVATVTPIAAPSDPADTGAAASDTAAALDSEPAEAGAGLGRDVSRGDAVADFSEVAFLSYADAGCVIDAMHEAIGTYDFTDSAAAEHVAEADIVARCVDGEALSQDPDASESDGERAAPSFEGLAEAMDDDETSDAADPSVDDDPTDETTEPDTEQTEADEPDGDETEAEFDEAMPDAEPEPSEPAAAPTAPSISPGSTSTGVVEIGGVDISYVAITPSGFTVGSQAPVLITLPDARQDLGEAEAVFRDAALARGWVVISPALPSQDWSEVAPLVWQFGWWIETWVDIEGGLPHLGGFGRGGSGALHIGAVDALWFQSISAYPGASTNRDQRNRSIAAPRAYVGYQQ